MRISALSVLQMQTAERGRTRGKEGEESLTEGGKVAGSMFERRR